MLHFYCTTVVLMAMNVCCLLQMIICIFATSDTWCMGGNHSMAPRICMQLYVIQAKVSGVFVPLAYIVLQREMQTSYEITPCLVIAINYHL